MRRHPLAAPLAGSLMAGPRASFPGKEAWPAHLEKPGFTRLDVTPDPVRVATGAAPWGGVRSLKFLCDGAVLSDDAGQFDVGRHAPCRVRAERLVHKPDTFAGAHRTAQAQVRGLIWDFCSELKDYRLKPGPGGAAALRERFDGIFLRGTGFVALDRLLKRLHTIGPESGIRCYVTRRKVGGGTRSVAGRDCRDAFLSLANTCAKLGVEAWDYLGSRLKVAGSGVVPTLDAYVRGRFRPA